MSGILAVHLGEAMVLDGRHEESSYVTTGAIPYVLDQENSIKARKNSRNLPPVIRQVLSLMTATVCGLPRTATIGSRKAASAANISLTVRIFGKMIHFNFSGMNRNVRLSGNC